MATKIAEWLKLPEAKNIRNLDDPSTTLLNAQIIQKKGFLKRIYHDYYKMFRSSIPNIDSKFCVELGSGGGFIKEVIPNAVTSDILDLPNVDFRFSVLNMPFKTNAVDAFFMIDVLHHIGDSTLFFSELGRCLKSGGKIIMVEPANTLWSRFIYQNFHHEPFDPSGGWGLTKTGPLSAANGAIPWIIFYRDRKKFEEEFPSIKIKTLKPHNPFRYLVSGGVSMRQLLPTFMYPIVKQIEFLLSPLSGMIGMFLLIVLVKETLPPRS